MVEITNTGEVTVIAGTPVALVEHLLGEDEDAPYYQQGKFQESYSRHPLDWPGLKGRGGHELT